MTRILIIGGYGAFGAHAAERLAREPSLEITIAGRSPDKAAAHAKALTRTAKAAVTHARVDATTATSEQIAALGPKVVINASGPFQDQEYQLARACIGAGCHYVDLADARAFVTGITRLDAQARAANVAVISGASSVPGLSSAVVQKFAGEFEHLDAIEIGISPGNRFDPGVATVASILRQAGKPHAVLRGAQPAIAYGWQGLHRHSFPGIGARWLSDIDVPDLDLLPAHYPSLQSVRFTAGVEVGLFHLGALGPVLACARGSHPRSRRARRGRCSQRNEGSGLSAPTAAACSLSCAAAMAAADPVSSPGISSRARATAPTCRRLPR